MLVQDQSASAIAHAYDTVPYESRAFPQTHPARSAALATLFGLTPPDVASARVLELGCAAGGNLIPLAAAYPQASFTGVDLSSVQIAQGRARIAALGLKNITLRHQSITGLSAGHGVFDYIICHGVYSWVPQPVRDAILRVASENLADTGVAYLSYNVYPGWHLRSVLREAMLFHVAGIQGPAEKLAAARHFLAQLAEITDPASAYGQLLRQEAKMIEGAEDFYLLHDHMEHTNEPCYVSELIGRARTAGLTFLSEASIQMTIAETFGPERGAMLRELSANRLDRMEQYIDFFTGRTFRQSLLVRQAQESSINRTLDPARLDGLYLHANLTLAGEENGTFILRDPAGRTLTTSNPFVRDCMLELAAHSPGFMTIDDLAHTTAAASALGHTPTASEITLLRDALLKMVMIGIAEVSTTKLSQPAPLSDKPTAIPLARADAMAGMTWTTNPRHETVPLNVVQQAVLPLLDGTHDVDALVAALREKVREGHIILQREGIPLTDETALAASARDHIDHALATFSRSALLIAA